MRVRYTTHALAEIEHIQDYIADHDPVAATETASSIRAQIETLMRYPHLGRPGRIVGTRELVITGTPYLAPYRIAAQLVVVLAVIHGARRWPKRF